MEDVGNRHCTYAHGGIGRHGDGCLDGDRSGTDGQRRTTCDRGRRQGLALDVSHDLKGRHWIRGPDAYVRSRRDDKGVLYADV